MTRADGLRVPTLREVAKAAQVSVSTASRALAGRPYVKDDVVERVRAAAADLGYHPNEAARGLRSAQTMTLGVLLYQLRQLPMIEYLDGFGAEAEAAGYAVFVANARGSDEQGRALLRRLFERRVDGLLIAAPGDLGDALRPYEESGVPVVLGLSRGSVAADLPLVMTSEAEAVRSAVAALRQLGHTSMAYFGTPRIVHTPRPSYLTQAGSEHGVSAQLVFLADDADAETVAQHLEQVMQPPTNATAVLINYTFVGPLMNAIRSRGLRIPGDLSVLTFSDYEPTDAFLDPPLSSIHSDVTAVGKRTAETLVHWIESGIRPPLTSDLKLSSWHQTVSVGPVPVRVSGG